MPGGRPPKDGGPRRHLELEELAAWFRQARADAGYASRNAVVNAELAHRNAVYDLDNAARLLPVEVVRAIAVGLRRDPDEVEVLWQRAKQGTERAEAVRKSAEEPHLTSWSQLPSPTLMVHNLMAAQSRSVERLPYDKLGVEEPPLSAVYVRQRIRTSIVEPEARAGAGGVRGAEAAGADSPARDSAGETADSVLPAPDALARHEHLLITGEPGAGKSTFSSHLAWTLSRIWLRHDSVDQAPLSEPVIPVRIAARTLVGQSGSWSAVLCQAVCRSLGSALVAEPAPSLFAGRVQGARWLVMVDGLDEIADREARAGVIRAVAQHARTGSDYRFVVTSRPLPEAELAPLRGSLVGAYRMEPFGEAELRDFAEKWFTAQYEDDSERARSAADRFLKETEDQRISELVRNPLLATIAAVNATVAPAKPLPTSRLSLYQRFCDHLLSRGPVGTDARAQVCARFAGDPQRRDFHLALEGHKRELLGELGRCRLEGESSLREAAADWVARQDWGTYDGQADDLDAFLLGTGLLVSDGTDHRFLHHSFAEFIAARAYAESIPPDFPDAEDWIRRGFTGDDSTLAIFVFCMWSRRAECSADVIAEKLLTGAAGGHQRTLLAGTLLAEGVLFGEKHRTEVLDRLEAIGRNAWTTDDIASAFEVMGALGEHSGVLARLERIAACEVLGPTSRLCAVGACLDAGHPRVAERLLRGVLSWIYGLLPAAALLASALGDGAREEVARRAYAMVAEPDADGFELAIAADTFASLGRDRETARMARATLEFPTVQPTHLRRAAEAWLGTQEQGVADDLVELVLRPVRDGQAGRIAVAEVLRTEGEPEAAALIISEVLRQGATCSGDLARAAQICVATQGAGCAPQIRTALERSSADHGALLYVPGQVLGEVVRFGFDEDIAQLARDVLHQHRWGVLGVGDVLATWLASAGPVVAEEVMEATNQGRKLSQYDRATVALAMQEAGEHDKAVELAVLALCTPCATPRAYRQSATVLLKVEGADAARRLPGIWRENPALGVDGDWLTGTLQALSTYEQGDVDETVEALVREQVAQPNATGEERATALRTLIRAKGRAATPFVVETIMAPGRLGWTHSRELARELAALRETDFAHQVWRFLLALPYPPQESELALLMDVQAAEATQQAAIWIRELIADPATYAPRRLRLTQLLAWLEAAESEGVGIHTEP